MGLYPSRSVPDSEYLLTRSIAEARLATQARTARAAAAHRAIANCYLAKLFGEQEADQPDTTRMTVDRFEADNAIGPVTLRFEDVTSLTIDEDLTRLLRSII
jgi:hypothetical protein